MHVLDVAVGLPASSKTQAEPEVVLKIIRPLKLAAHTLNREKCPQLVILVLAIFLELLFALKLSRHSKVKSRHEGM